MQGVDNSLYVWYFICSARVQDTETQAITSATEKKLSMSSNSCLDPLPCTVARRRL